MWPMESMRGAGTFNSRSTGWVRPQEALGAPCEVGSHSMEMPADGGIHGRRWQCKHACCWYGVLIGRQYGCIDHPRPHAAPGGRNCPKISEIRLNKLTRQRAGGAMAGRQRGRSAHSALHGVHWVQRYRHCPQQRLDPAPTGANGTIRAWFVLVWNRAEMATDGDTSE